MIPRVLKALLALRVKAGISRIAAAVGLSVYLYGSHEQWPATSIALNLVVVAGFSLIMIFLQWLEQRLKYS